MKYTYKINLDCDLAYLQKLRSTHQEYNNSFFQNIEWIKTSYLTKTEKTNLCVVEILHENNLVLILPFEVTKIFFFKILRWFNDKNLDFITPIYVGKHNFNDKEISILLRKLFDDFSNVDFIFLVKNKKRYKKIYNPICDFKTINKHYIYKANLKNQSWQEYYEDVAGSKTRQTDRKKERSFLKNNNYNFKIAKNDNEKKKIFEFTVNYKIQFLKKKNYSKKYIKNFTNFYRVLYEEIKEKENYIFSSLQVNDEILASAFGAVFDNTYYYLMPSDNRGKYEHLSPGRLLLINQIKWLIDQKIDIINFGPGQQTYKKYWHNEVCCYYDVIHWKGSKGFLIYLIYTLKKLLFVK